MKPQKLHEGSGKECESYMNDLEKSRDDSGTQSHESYLKDPEKSHARNRKS